MTIAPTRPLSDGGSIPQIGLGTYGLTGDDGTASIVSAISAGYRLIDTGLRYENEREVGEGMRRSGVPREELQVTTKLRGRDHGYEETLRGFEESLANLALEYVDLYLIHWPLPRQDRYVESWKAMIQLQKDGMIRSIGVSNFLPEHIDRLVAETGVTPVVNQVELHPNFPQTEQLQYDAAHDIVTESWSPLAQGGRFSHGNAVIDDAAEAHGVTQNQVVLRWHVQRGAVPIPKSGDAKRQRENLDIFGFELTDAEVASITDLASGRLWGADPATHEEF